MTEQEKALIAPMSDEEAEKIRFTVDVLHRMPDPYMEAVMFAEKQDTIIRCHTRKDIIEEMREDT